MPVPIANTEPTTITAGDSATWTQSVSDFPATDGYTLTYALQGPGQYTFAATAIGSDYSITISPEITVTWTPGTYVWTAFVSKTGERRTVGHGALIVLPNPITTLAKSHAQTALELINAALIGRIPRGLENTNIDGQELSRIPLMQLHSLRDKYRREVIMEQSAARSAAGISPRRTIGIRFVNAR